MSLETFATVDDLKARWSGLSLTDDEVEKTQTLLADASAHIRVRCKQAGVDIASFDEDMKNEAKRITCAVVRRIMDGLDDLPSLSSMQETTGPYSATYNFTYNTNDLYLTKEEKVVLGIRRFRMGYILPMMGGRNGSS